MARAQTYTPSPIMRGDTWAGFTVTGVLVNDANPVSAAASATLEFFQKTAAGLGPAKLSIPVTITNATTWAMTAPAQVLPLGAAIGTSG